MGKNEKLKTPKGSGCSGFWTRFWYSLLYWCVGIKWNIIEIFTRHRKLNMQKLARRPRDCAVITGGVRGIGVQVIKKLLILDMQVVIGCRNEAAGNEMIEDLRKQGVHTGKAQTISLDLMSLNSVRQFSEKVLKKYRKIHILINNAGIMLTPYQLTTDDLESQFQVNYLSHFLLTQLLLPKLKTTGTPEKPSRIVNVSSVAHYGGKINFEDLQMSKLYSPEMAYMASKMMQVIFTKDLETRLKSEGANVHVYAVHPGVVKTDLYENVCIANSCSCCVRILFKTPLQGSDCVAYAALSPKVAAKGGNFFANCKKETLVPEARKPEVQQQLWNISCELTGLQSLSNSKPKLEIPTITIENEVSLHVLNNKSMANDEKQETVEESYEESNNRGSANSYESRSTDMQSLEQGVTTEEEATNNEQEDLTTSNIVENVEKSSEMEIVAMSVELVDEIVEKSEEIVNERTRSENEHLIPQFQNDDVSKDNVEMSIENQTQERDAVTNSTTEEKNNINTIEENKKSDEITENKNLDPVISSTKSQDDKEKDADNAVVIQEEEKSKTVDYGSVQITEIVESDNHLNTPDITITQASDPGSDTDSNVSVPVTKD